MASRIRSEMYMPRTQALQRAKAAKAVGSASKGPVTTSLSKADVPTAWKPECGAGPRSFAAVVASKPGTSSSTSDSAAPRPQLTRLGVVGARPAEAALARQNQTLEAENLLLKKQVQDLMSTVADLRTSVQELATQVANLRGKKQDSSRSPPGSKSKGKPKAAVPETDPRAPDQATFAAIQKAVCTAVNEAMSRLVGATIANNG